MTVLEKDIEYAMVGMVKRYGGMCLKWVCPGWSGVPDRIILLPGGRIVFVETKRPNGGRIAPLQTWWARKLRGLGFRYVLVKNGADLTWLEQYIRES